MGDLFKNFSANLSSPAERHYQVEPSDDTDLPTRPRALYISTDGTVAMQMGGVAETYNVLAGSVLPVRPSRVLATGTTATVIAWA